MSVVRHYNNNDKHNINKNHTFQIKMAIHNKKRTRERERDVVSSSVSVNDCKGG